MKKLLYNIKTIYNAIKWHYIRPTKKQFKSKGEALIRSWLAYSNVKFKEQFEVYLPELNTKTNIAYIDFVVNKPDGRKYAIEFNGKQHYSYTPFFHKGGIIDFHKQQNRDKIVKDWCLNNGYIFLEIPYSFNTDDVVQILKDNFNDN